LIDDNIKYIANSLQLKVKELRLGWKLPPQK